MEHRHTETQDTYMCNINVNQSQKYLIRCCDGVSVDPDLAGCEVPLAISRCVCETISDTNRS